MDNKTYVDLVNKGEFPEEVSVCLDAPYTDNRGIIQNIWLGKSGSVTYIVTKKGEKRAEHKHSHDFHGTFIITGSIKYIEVADDEKTILYERIFNANEMFFSKPDVFHIMEFLEDTKMITVNGIIKNHTNYEQSIIRMKDINENK